MGLGGHAADPRIIWDRPQNPTKYVSDVLGIERWELRAALHVVKARSNIAATGRVVIYSDGKVTDTNGAEIGNILDEI